MSVTPPHLRSKRENSDAEKSKHSARCLVKQLATLQDTCADCTETQLSWVSFPIGLFICSSCANIHKQLSDTYVKNYLSDTFLFFPDEINALHLMGNEKASHFFRGKNDAPPPLDPSHDNHLKLIRANELYKEKKWYFDHSDPVTHLPPKPTGFFESFGL